MTALDHAILWHLYPLTATGAQIRGGRKPGRGVASLSAWLDYLVELGCDTLLLAPIFQSHTHGYDTIDHYRIDDRLGDEEDFGKLVGECRRRGITVVLDGVFNHVAADHSWVDQGLTTGRSWEGHEELAELNHGDERVADEVVAIMNYWLDRGIAGWRLDVAYAVPTAFWAKVTDRVRQTHPDAVFLGEIIHGDYAALLRDGHLDVVTQYELWKALWSSLKDTNMHELAHALGRHNEFLEAGYLNTFVGNHDTDRIASVVGQDQAILAAAILFTLPGVPSIYYGDEQGFEGLRGEGYAADDPVRPPLPETPAELSPLGARVHEFYQRFIAFRRRHDFLTTARVEIREVDNARLSYRVARAGDWLDVTVGVPGEFSAIASDGEELKFSL